VRQLTREDLRQFARDGFLLLSGLVPENLLEQADREVEGLIAERPPDPSKAGRDADAWFPPVSRLPACDQVLRGSPVLAAAGELVAPYTLDHAFDHIQVATTESGWNHVPGGPHIDGHNPAEERPSSFTVLIGVFLTDQTRSQSGNLWVWPGSHLDHQSLFRQRGTRALMDVGGHCTLLEPPTPLGPALELKGRRGDVVIAHYLLGHNKGGNTSGRTRRSIYYRLSVPDHPQRWERTFLDVLTEFPAVMSACAPASTP
jgi:ectoine hydroxylase-related dioxygenase (phytanoyl-CoA dioxygenase family)